MNCNAECEEKLAAAVAIYHEKWINTLPKDEELQNISFSGNFRKRMAALINGEREKERSEKLIFAFTPAFRRITSLLFASVIFVSMALMSVAALRDSIFGYFRNNEEQAVIVYLSEDPAYNPNTVFAETKFVVPAGFEKDDYNCSADFFSTQYTNDAGNYIRVFQGLVYGGGTITLDSEGCEIVSVDLFGSNAFYYEKDGNRLFWQDGISYYLMISDLPQDEMMEIARSSY